MPAAGTLALGHAPSQASPLALHACTACGSHPHTVRRLRPCIVCGSLDMLPRTVYRSLPHNPVHYHAAAVATHSSDCSVVVNSVATGTRPFHPVPESLLVRFLQLLQ